MAILKFKQNLNFYLKLIDSRLAEHDYLGALDASRRAKENARTYANKESLNLLIAEIYFNMELFTLSLQHYFRAVTINEVSASALFGIGACLMKKNHISLAYEYFDECIRTPSHENFAPLIENIINSLSHSTPTLQPNQIAKKLIEKNKINEAINLINNQTQQTLDTQILLANAYIKNHQLDLAREILFKLLRLNPSYVPAFISLCELCVNENDLPNLATILTNLNTIPPNFEHYMQIAHYHCILQNWDSAISFYQKATVVSPYSTTAETLLSLCYLNQHNKKEALYHIGKARWIDIENPLINEISDLIQKDLFSTPVEVKLSLPNDIITSKQQDIFSSLNNQFCKNMLNSMWLPTDVDWALSTHNHQLSLKIIESLSQCRHKRTQTRYKNYLLDLNLSKNQKFILIKHAIISKNLKKINFTTNYRIKSFCYFVPKKLDKKVLNCYAAALSFCAIFDVDFNLKYDLPQIKQQIIQNNLSENEGACLFFRDNDFIFHNACIYFGASHEKLSKLMVNSDENE